MQRALIAILLCAAALAARPPTAHAQGYPSKPVHIIVPYAPGGPVDTFTRALGTQLASRLGQPVVIDNKPGANTLIGAEAAARSPADGYTLLMASVSTLALNTSTYKKLPYDPLKDFSPVSLAFYSPLYLVVNTVVPARTVDELVAAAKAKPGGYAYASTGRGGAIHLVTEMFKSVKGIDMLHVPYKGTAPGLADLVAGQVQVMFDVGSGSLAMAKAGRVRVLAVTGPRRAEAAPEVPTMTEAGTPGFDMTVWFGMVAPAGTPRPVLERLSSEIDIALKLPAFKDIARANGYELSGNSPDAFAELIRRDTQKWGEMVRVAGFVPE